MCGCRRCRIDASMEEDLANETLEMEIRSELATTNGCRNTVAYFSLLQPLSEHVMTPSCLSKQDLQDQQGTATVHAT